MKASLFVALASALATPEIGQKLALTAAIASDWQAGRLDWLDATPLDLVCGRPARPELVPPRMLPQRGIKNPEGRARMLHAIVHIEFSAINLALDHAARFRGMPEQYYADWIGVAAEEAYHFTILRERLQALGHDYGDFPAHAGLWDMAEKTTAMCWRAWRWSRACSKHAGSTPRRRSATSWPRQAMANPPACSTSSCTTKSAMLASATPGSDASAANGISNPRAPIAACWKHSMPPGRRLR